MWKKEEKPPKEKAPPPGFTGKRGWGSPAPAHEKLFFAGGTVCVFGEDGNPLSFIKGKGFGGVPVNAQGQPGLQLPAHAFGAAGFFDKQAFDMGAVYADKAVDGGGSILLTDIYFCPGQLGAPLAGMFRSV